MVRRSCSFRLRREGLWVGAVVAALVLAGGIWILFSHRPTSDPAVSALHAPPPPVDSAAANADPSPATGPSVGQLAPDFSLASLDGGSITLSTYRGQVVILDFWASWCSPCRATMPALHEYWRSVADRGVVFVAVSLDRTLEAARTYLQANGFDDMIAVWGSFSAASAVASRYGASAIPRTVIIDAAGVIHFNDHPARLPQGLVESLL